MLYRQYQYCAANKLRASFFRCSNAIKMYFFVPSVRPCMDHNYGGILGSHACKDFVWPIILGAGLCTTFRGERVLVVIRFNATFLLMRPYYKYIYISVSWMMQKIEQRMVARFDAVGLFIFVLIFWTLQQHFTFWLSARTLQCLFEGVYTPQYFRTLPGLDQGWTQYWLANSTVKKVSLALFFYLQHRYQTFCCVCFDQSALCRLCVFVLYGLRVCFKTLKLKLKKISGQF